VLLVNPQGNADEFGDEPLLIARRLGCPVVVGESRLQAGMLAEKHFSSQLHILDDGFQHRSLARDFDIVLLTPADIRDHLLPEGRLREPLSCLRRANAVVLMDNIDPHSLSIGNALIWRVRRGISLTDPPNNPIVFCGIARPSSLVEQLRASGVREAAAKFYRDHHQYSQRDIRDLLQLKQQSGAGGFITTEKDAINLGPLLSDLGQVSLASVTMELGSPDAALDTLVRVVADRKALA
jgi:tetraacyldisaccharide 4'-kinase